MLSIIKDINHKQSYDRDEYDINRVVKDLAKSSQKDKK